MKADKVREFLIMQDLKFFEFGNGMFQIDNVNFFSKSELWHDKTNNVYGKGLPSMLQHVQKLEVISCNLHDCAECELYECHAHPSRQLP